MFRKIFKCILLIGVCMFVLLMSFYYIEKVYVIVGFSDC